MHWLSKIIRHETGDKVEDVKRRKKGFSYYRADIESSITTHFPTNRYEIGLILQNESPYFITQEDHESHSLLIGTTGEGKSKLVEVFVREDLGKHPIAVLDASPHGDTVYDILKYCASEGFTNVCLIDPWDWNCKPILGDYGVVPVLNPIHYKATLSSVQSSIADTIRVLWKADDFKTPRINLYSKALATALWYTGQSDTPFTLSDASYFLQFQEYELERHAILSHSPQHLRNDLNSVHKNLMNWERYFSTVGRLKPSLDNDIFKLMVGSNRDPIPFSELIRDNWIILVNLYKKDLWDSDQQRLLGIMVINELFKALSFLVRGRKTDSTIAQGWKGRLYLYIDEAEQFMTDNMVDTLRAQRHEGVSLNLSCQYSKQFDPHEWAAIKALTKIKIMFNLPDRESRDEMIRMMYGGELSDRAVSYALSGLVKQHAIVKNGKDSPKEIRVKDLPQQDISPEALGDFKKLIYRNNPWYRTPKSVREEIKNRIANIERPSVFAGRSTRSHNTTEKDANTEPEARAHTGVPRGSEIFDGLPDGGLGIRSPGGRKPGKRNSSNRKGNA